MFVVVVVVVVVAVVEVENSIDSDCVGCEVGMDVGRRGLSTVHASSKKRLNVNS